MCNPTGPQTLSVTLNPWAGGVDGHVVKLQLRRLEAVDKRALDALAASLAAGRQCALHLDNSMLSLGELQQVQMFPLSAQAVSVEATVARFSEPERTALVLGAGVLAHRVVECLADTPLRVAWAPLGSPQSLATWPANAVALGGSFVPGDTRLPDGCHALVMTHDHDLDIDLCHRLLLQNDVASVGMVGSYKKRAHLHSALRTRGLDDATIAKVRCPLGGGNHGNLEHASVAIAAELLAQN